MESTKRICILGLPRSGSQYVAELICTNINAMNLLEPFTKDTNNPYKLSIQKGKFNNNLVFLEEFPTAFSVPESLNILKSGDIHQSLVLKLFPYAYLNKNIPEILSTLIELKFEFVILKRKNVKHHLLSYGVALATDTWTDLVHPKKPVAPRPDKVTITDFETMEWLWQATKRFDEQMKNWNITADTIYYEDAVNGVAKLLNKPITTDKLPIKKQSPANPWDRIENVEEVKAFLNKLNKK